jgi:hypothetical protein
MLKVNQVILKLEGGLGNQLFQFAAGYFVAAKNNSDLLIDQYSIPLTTVHGEKGIGFSEFEINQLPGSKSIILSRNLPNKFLTKWAKRYPIAKRVLLKARMWTSNPRRLSLFTETNEESSKEDFLKIQDSVKLHGNFQSWEIVVNAAQYGFPRVLRLRDTPNWINQLQKKIHFSKSIVLHFRVGDDTRTNENFKQPDISYYLAAVQVLRTKKVFTMVYIMSDDIIRTKKMFGNELDKDFQYLEMPANSSPAERLYILSLFGGIVCANSTFCGWAAWSISNSGGEVIVPIPYSDGPVLGSRDFPHNWIKLDKNSGAEIYLD